MFTVITPETLHGDTAAAFFQCLSGMLQRQEQWLQKGRFGYFDNGYPFQLGKNMLIRRSKKPDGSLRCEFWGDIAFDKGTFGGVFPIDVTFKSTVEGFILKTARTKTGFKRLVKIQKHTERHSFGCALEEQRMIERAGYGGSKPPVFHAVANLSFIVMRQAPGRNLFDTLLDVYEQRLSISNARRLELSIAILEAMETHLAKPHILHRDLSPDNLMVDLSTPKPTVTIIDFGLSTTEVTTTTRVCGKLAFCAPEMMTEGALQTLKADIYTVARGLAMVWGISLESYDHTLRFSEYKKNAENPMLDSLFTNCDPLLADAKTAIKNALMGMLNPDWEKRFDITQSLSAFRRVNLNVPSLKTLLHNHLFSQKTDTTPNTDVTVPLTQAAL